MRHIVRYDVKRDYGGQEKETRREYSARFGQGSPETPEVQACVWHLAEWFFELNARRQYTDSAPLPITFGELSNWAGLTGRYLQPREVLAIMEMDDAYLQVSAAEAEAVQARREAAQRHNAKRRR